MATPTLILDTECYPNYWLLLMISNIGNGKPIGFEVRPDRPMSKGESSRINALLHAHLSIGFNSKHYDLPMITAACAGWGNERLKKLNDELILSGDPGWMVCRRHNLKVPDYDHIDLIKVAKGTASLKLYGARLGTKKLQDLPYDPITVLTPRQAQEVRNYCGNDLVLTTQLYRHLKPQLALRSEINAMYSDYRIDTRSMGDAQIAEAIIKNECRELMGGAQIEVPTLPKRYHFNYTAPAYIEFLTPQLQELKEQIEANRFMLTEKGSATLPPWLRTKKIVIGDLPFRMGIGGIHSQEKSVYHKSEDGQYLIDQDVTSYYPNIILTNQYSPRAYGRTFLPIYQDITDRRTQAKVEGEVIASDTYKIVLNSSFGKAGNRFSTLYDPSLLIHVTITGQLTLLMLIESFVEVGGIHVVSANTDGVVTLVRKDQLTVHKMIVDAWQAKTRFNLEFTYYDQYLGRDVNNYVALTASGKAKGKGAFAPISIDKNPDNTIIYEAVTQFLIDGTPVDETIMLCGDITKFVSVRTVRGGALHDWDYLGEVVRFYRSVYGDKPIVYATNGNKVPKSDNCQPLQDIPPEFPFGDVDYGYYIQAAKQLLVPFYKQT